MTGTTVSGSFVDVGSADYCLDCWIRDRAHSLRIVIKSGLGLSVRKAGASDHRGLAYGIGRGPVGLFLGISRGSLLLSLLDMGRGCGPGGTGALYGP